MKLLITDDEYLARERLKKLLSQCEPEAKILEAENGIEAMSICQEQDVDLLLLDIRMPQMDGLETAWHLTQLDNPPAVIFVSAYDDYALKAFSVNAIDYILKPAKLEQLQQALKKAAQLNRVQLSSIQANNDHQSKRQHLSAKLAGEIELIPLSDIYYCQAEQKYIKVKHKKGESLIEEPLKALEQEFFETFIRIHRNALVSKRFISGIKKDSSGRLYVLLNGCKDRLEVSRRHASAVRKLVRSL